MRGVFSALIAMQEALGNPVEVPQAARYPGGGLREDADLQTVATALQVPYEQVIPQAERLLDMIGSAPGGVWLPADARVAFYRAQTFSALDSLVRFYVDHLNAPDAAKEIVVMLGNGKSKLAAQFQRFAKDIILAQRRTLPLDALVKDIRELRDLGLGALDRLWEPLREQGFFNSVQQKAAVAIVERCDSRVECQTRCCGAPCLPSHRTRTAVCSCGRCTWIRIARAFSRCCASRASSCRCALGISSTVRSGSSLPKCAARSRA
jgi:hypothetical protein